MTTFPSMAKFSPKLIVSIKMYQNQFGLVIFIYFLSVLH